MADKPSANKIGSNLNISDKELHISRSDLSPACQDKPFNQFSNSPLEIAYVGQINGIKMTGPNHSPRIFNLFFLA